MFHHTRVLVHEFIQEKKWEQRLHEFTLEVSVGRTSWTQVIQSMESHALEITGDPVNGKP